MKILLFVLFVVLVISLGIGYFLFRFALERDFRFHLTFKSNDDKEKEDQLAMNLTYFGDGELRKAFDELCEEWEIVSDDGLKLKGCFLRNAGHRYIICCHGYFGSHKEMITTAMRFHDWGYSVLCPDARAHGDSEGKYRGMGYLERKDVAKWMEKIREYDEDLSLALYGRSMGGATVLMSMCHFHPDYLKCVIEDCGYYSVHEEFAYFLRHDFHLPSFLIMPMASLICKIKAHYFLGETNVLKKLEDSAVPCLFIHGNADTFVPYRFVNEMYGIYGEKDIFVVEDAGHAMAMVKDPEEYFAKIEAFVNRHISG